MQTLQPLNWGRVPLYGCWNARASLDRRVRAEEVTLPSLGVILWRRSTRHCHIRAGLLEGFDGGGGEVGAGFEFQRSKRAKISQVGQAGVADAGQRCQRDCCQTLVAAQCFDGSVR